MFPPRVSKLRPATNSSDKTLRNDIKRCLLFDLPGLAALSATAAARILTPSVPNTAFD